MKRLFPIIFILVVGYIIYQKSPFFRDQVDAAKGKWTSWSDEQIKKDPGKFLEQAEAKIKSNLKGLKDSEDKLAKNINELTEKRNKSQATVQKADELAAEFKAAYKQAEAEGAWPITVKGDEYTKDGLVDQVKSIMTEKGTYETILKAQNTNIEKATSALGNLKQKVTELEGELTTIASKKTTLENDKMLAEADEWLAKINKQVEESGSEKLIEGPKAIEDFMKEDEAKAVEEAKEAAKAAAQQETLDFLES